MIAAVATGAWAAQRPVISRLDPPKAEWKGAGYPPDQQNYPFPMTLHVFGKGFKRGAAILFDRKRLKTRFVSSTELTAIASGLSVSDVAWRRAVDDETIGIVYVEVWNPGPLARRSKPFPFTVGFYWQGG